MLVSCDAAVGALSEDDLAALTGWLDRTAAGASVPRRSSAKADPLALEPSARVTFRTANFR
jgi:hypothetical protein